MFFGEYDYETDIRVQRREAFEDGVAEGIEQGAEKTKIETAKKLISMGLSLAQVVEGTGLPLEKVQELANSQQG